MPLGDTPYIGVYWEVPAETGVVFRSGFKSRDFRSSPLPGYIKQIIFIKLHINFFLFCSIPKAQDPVVEKLYQSTEEGQKVTRNKGVKLVAVFRRIQDPYVT